MTVRVEREAYSLPVFDFAALHTVKFAAPASPNLEVFGLPDPVQQFGSLFRLAASTDTKPSRIRALQFNLAALHTVRLLRLIN
jgi:hypothetical protein